MGAASTDRMLRFLRVTAALSHARRMVCIGRSAYLSYSKVLTSRESREEITGLAAVEPLWILGQRPLELHTRLVHLPDREEKNSEVIADDARPRMVARERAEAREGGGGRLGVEADDRGRHAGAQVARLELEGAIEGRARLVAAPGPLVGGSENQQGLDVAGVGPLPQRLDLLARLEAGEVGGKGEIWVEERPRQLWGRCCGSLLALLPALDDGDADDERCREECENRDDESSARAGRHGASVAAERRQEPRLGSLYSLKRCRATASSSSRFVARSTRSIPLAPATSSRRTRSRSSTSASRESGTRGTSPVPSTSHAASSSRGSSAPPPTARGPCSSTAGAGTARRLRRRRSRSSATRASTRSPAALWTGSGTASRSSSRERSTRRSGAATAGTSSSRRWARRGSCGSSSRASS